MSHLVFETKLSQIHLYTSCCGNISIITIPSAVLNHRFEFVPLSLGKIVTLTWLSSLLSYKQVWVTIGPYIQKLTNINLTSGRVPGSCKHAGVQLC